MRFEIPQYIEIEDKIFGPFTWRQFVYLTGGCLLGVALYLLLPFILAVIIGLPIVGLAVALAFYPINNRPFSFFLESVVSYLTSHHLYIWRRKTPTQIKKAFEPESSPSPSNPVSTPTPGQIANLAHRLEIASLEENGPAKE